MYDWFLKLTWAFLDLEASSEISYCVGAINSVFLPAGVFILQLKPSS
jgi:hypothetical protein